jgi:hypothetical protein
MYTSPRMCNPTTTFWTNAKVAGAIPKRPTLTPAKVKPKIPWVYSAT